MRLPEWLKDRHRASLHETKYLLRRHRRLSVCEEARCPNRGTCFSKPTAAFLILGPACTRNCGFCCVDSGLPAPVDACEPEEVALAAAEMALKFVVITSVTRDDLPDGGSGQFAKTIAAVRSKLPEAKVEVLIPDFAGDPVALRTVLEAGPDVLNHNMETVGRLYAAVRPGADYRRSLAVFRQAKEIAPEIPVKSGLMLGLGETVDEVYELLADMRQNQCEILTVGQYLQPTRKNLPVVKYILPSVFDELREKALSMGFRFVASGPLVRSSMKAEEMFRDST
jgi:lipoic acid synthetase